jgi:hypothetical protein
LLIIAPAVLAKLNGVDITEHKARLFKGDLVFRRICGGLIVIPLKIIVFQGLMVIISLRGAQGSQHRLWNGRSVMPLLD